MTVFQIVALVSTGLCFLALFSHFIKIIRLGAPKDLSQKSGSIYEGVVYANTKAMLPNEKESAYMHLPTYSAGIIFHIGVFSSLLLFILSFFPFFTKWMASGEWYFIVLGICFLISATCGLSLIIKRLFNKNLHSLSNLDDYLSNGLTTLFQYMTAFYILSQSCICVNTAYYISISLLMLYMPWGKLKHVVYYFAARFHLGFFYGRRNVWPPKKR